MRGGEKVNPDVEAAAPVPTAVHRVGFGSALWWRDKNAIATARGGSEARERVREGVREGGRGS